MVFVWGVSVPKVGFCYLGGLCTGQGFCSGGSLFQGGFLFLGGKSMFPGESLRSGGGTIPGTTKEDRSHPTGMLSCYILVTRIVALFID